MRDVASILELILLVLFVMALVFLFEGDPDVWDSLQERAMNTECLAVGKATSEEKYNG